MKVRDVLGRVNESAPPRVPSALRIIYAPPELACSPRLPIMARLHSSFNPGPVRASVGTIRGLYSFVPGNL